MKHFVLALMATAMMCTQAEAQTRVKNLSTSTSKLNVEMLQGDNQVTLTRYFFAGYNTLCLPMSMTASQVQQAAKDLRVERLAAIEQQGDALCLLFVDCTADGIEAGVPYLVYSPTNQTLRASNTEAMNIGTDVRTIRLSDAEGNTVAFSSSWESMARVGRYGIPAQQNTTPLESILVCTEGDKTFLPTRCGFAWEQQSSTAKELLIKHVTMQEVNAISQLNADGANGQAYDLQGRRVSTSQKGIVIVNNKKVRN